MQRTATKSLKLRWLRTNSKIGPTVVTMCDVSGVLPLGLGCYILKQKIFADSTLTHPDTPSNLYVQVVVKVD